jgi:hypothetical protein
MKVEKMEENSACQSRMKRLAKIKKGQDRNPAPFNPIFYEKPTNR